MEKRIRIILFISILVFAIVIIPVLSNPIVPTPEMEKHMKELIHPPPPDILQPEMIIFFILGLSMVYLVSSLLEFGVAYLFLKKYLSQISKLLKSILIINAITFPITQVLALFFMSSTYDITWTFYLAELFPFFAEFYLLRWQFKKFHSENILSAELSDKKVLLIAGAMNLLTFILGIIAVKLIT